MDIRKLNKRREFSEQIRRKVVGEFREGRYTVKELADLYQVSTSTIYRWIYKYSPADSPSVTVVEMADSTDRKVQELQDKIARLERALGQKQITIDLQAKMIELAEADYDLDLKKSISGKRSSGSGSTEN
jgi:transposase